MDPLAHTLVGAALGRAVAGRDVPAAGWIGAIAANAPDWSELVLKPDLWPPRAGGEYLVFHRGITHSFVGAVVEAAVLTGLFGLLLRLWARRAMVPAPLWRWVATCVTATVASHLYLDWQGSYGLRPFLPWSAQWYYGDWVAIVDPFFWVVPLVGLAWGARRHWAPALVYLVTLLGVTTLVLWRGHDLVVWWVRLALVGCAAAGVVGWTRHWFGVAGRRRGGGDGVGGVGAAGRGEAGGRPRAPTAGRPCRSGSADAVRLGGAMSHPSPPADLLDDVVRALTPAFRLDQRVAATPERAVYHAWDRVLKRSVALHVHLAPDSPGRAWFLRETETLAALDHPAIRHVYAAGVVGTFAYRTANWVEGESLAEALRRGPRPIRTAHALVRDLLGAAEHAHARGVILRRIVPLTLMLEHTGRAVITDLRYCNWCLPNVPPEERGAGGAFVAPEVRTGSPGEPRSDVYGVAALVYYVLTGQEPDLDPARITPPRQLRPAVPAALERVLLRALQAAPGARYYTATEMLEDFVSDAGVFQEPAAAPQVAEAGFERRLRRALGDDYELLEEIGTGGFGRVYRARDLGLEREVAMKVLHPSLTTDPSVMERFRREAQLAARLRHPSIVNIYDIRSRAGLQWYTMELVPGMNLAQLVHKRGPLSLDQTVRVLDQALSALEHAHPLGLVHRDLKPEHMLIEPYGRRRITDFGLALALRGDARWGGATSRSGTPQFAAPEQLLGERADQRADLYSLAATAYFALLGRPPFEGATPEIVLARQTTEDPPALHASRHDVSRELEDVLQMALASEPAARYPTATAFRDALRRSRGWRSRLGALLRGG